MDGVSYAHSAKQAQRIEKFIENPDSTSGIVTVPKTIASGETITIPAGRVAVLPNIVVDGDLVVEAGGEIFVPAGANFSDLEGQIATKQSKSELAYSEDTGSYIPNTLPGGAIIERGSNANGEYVKFADGTLVCTAILECSGSVNIPLGSLYTTPSTVWYFPSAFASAFFFLSGSERFGVGNCFLTRADGANETHTMCSFKGARGAAVNLTPAFALTAIGRWK